MRSQTELLFISHMMQSPRITYLTLPWSTGKPQTVLISSDNCNSFGTFNGINHLMSISSQSYPQDLILKVTQQKHVRFALVVTLYFHWFKKKNIKSAEIIQVHPIDSGIPIIRPTGTGLFLPDRKK